MKKAVGALAAALLFAAPLSPAAAGMITKAQIAQTLQSEGYAVQDFKANMLKVAAGEYEVVVAVQGADGDISYIAYLWDLSIDNVGHEFLSKFNSEVKFGRAYADRDGDIAIQMDRNAAGGVTVQNIQSDFDVFLLLISKFLSDIESRASA